MSAVPLHESGALERRREAPGERARVLQVHLAHKKHPPPKTLQ